MPFDPKDLEARIAAATPQDTVRGLFFNSLFDTVEEHAGPEAAAGCDPSGKGRRTDFFSYPVADFLGAAGRAVDLLEPRLGSTDRAFFELGYRALAGVFATALGSTILLMARKEPRSLLVQAPTAYKGTVSYGERRLEWLGPRHARLTFLRDFLVPAYHCGVFTAALDAVGAQGPKATGVSSSLLDATYEVTWG